MEPIHVIRRPILTEKSTFDLNELGRYTFLVDRRASKDDIRRAVESLYGVKVARVCTQVRKGGWRRLRRGWTKESETKKATVRLREGDRIDLL
jgi:large subunit ribosomal protein L23